MKKISFLLFLHIFSCFWLFLPTITLAAETPSVKTGVWPSTLTVGDEIILTLRIDRPKNIILLPPSEKTNCAPFEIKRIEMLPIVEKGTRVTETFRLVLTIFDLGDLTIPPIPIDFKTVDGRSGEIVSASMKVKVIPVATHPEKDDQLKPIKGPVSLDTRLIRTLILGFVAGILSMILMIKIVLRRLRKKILDLESLKPPHERALLELERLRQKEFLQQGKLKEFYSEIADILRRYLGRRFAMETLELTTVELITALKEKNFEQGLIEKIKRSLEAADLVKFAKFMPSRAEGESMEKELIGILDEIC